ncbi:MAG: cation transporter, partial [Acidimicrobiales bacterium]
MTLTNQPESVPLGSTIARRSRQSPEGAADSEAPERVPASVVAPDTSFHALSFAVSGMTCGACAARIERHLNDIDGVSAVVNLATERASVTAPESIGPSRIVDEVASLGYR